MKRAKVGLLGLIAFAITGFVVPATASAQDRCDRGYYAPAPSYYAPAPRFYAPAPEYFGSPRWDRDRFGREREWRITRDREIRERDWHFAHDRRDGRPYGYR